MLSSIRGRHVVVAHFNEDLDWLHELYKAHPTAVIYVYSKAATDSVPKAETLPPATKVIPLPNVGRESHTYINHILSHYDNIGDYTFFTQGHPFDHRSLQEIIKNYMTSTVEFYPPHPPNHVLHSWKFVKGTIKNSGGTIADWWRKVFGRVYPRRGLRTAWNGIFTVKKSRILARPRDFYERLIMTVDHDVNPEEGHFIERTWGDILSS